jgi:transposase InsO family protein
MTGRSPGIALGHRVYYRDRDWLVAEVRGAQVTLTQSAGEVCAVLLTHLVGADDFAVLDAPGQLPVPSEALLEAVDAGELARARRLEAHILQVEHGCPGSEETGHDPRYDLATTSLLGRVAAKVEELAGTDLATSDRHFRRARARYRAEGLLGLIDGRVLRRAAPSDPLAKVDDRVVTALATAMAARTGTATITRRALFVQVRTTLRDEHGPDVPIPHERVLYRLAAQLDRGLHTFGSATTRRTTANRPDRPFTSGVALRPGEQVQIDTNTIDILCRYADGVTRRAELTIAVDVATRSILTGVIAPTTKAVDAVAVLARIVVPESLRPGWPESLLFAHSTLPFDRLVGIDARFAQAEARPVILPDTLVCDRGSVYMSETFLRACRGLGVSVQPARPYTPTDKGVVERTFASINSLFCQHVNGYVGSNVVMRGKDPAAEAVFNIGQLQELFDEWVVAVWQNRPHEFLTNVWGQNRSVSPNEAYSAMVARSGYVPVPRSTIDYIELLPARWRVINEDGVTVDNRVYDASELNPYRRTDSGITAMNGRWEVHCDPYDVTVVWIRNHHQGGWITAPWVHRDLVGQPFGAAIYEHVRAQAARPGMVVRDDYIARRIAELLGAGPHDEHPPADTRAVARERNNPTRRGRHHQPPVDDRGNPDTADDDDDAPATDTPAADPRPAGQASGRKAAKVAGFPVFDPTSDEWSF